MGPLVEVPHRTTVLFLFVFFPNGHHFPRHDPLLSVFEGNSCEPSQTVKRNPINGPGASHDQCNRVYRVCDTILKILEISQRAPLYVRGLVLASLQGANPVHQAAPEAQVFGQNRLQPGKGHGGSIDG